MDDNPLGDTQDLLQTSPHNLVRQGTFTEHDALYVESDVVVGSGTYTIKKGFYLKDGEDEQAGFFTPSRTDDGGAIIPGPFSDPPKTVQAYKKMQKLCRVSVLNAAACKVDARYRFTTKPVALADSFQQTLIYSGKVGSRIKLGYREFSANIARPAFSNDVEYDLSTSRIIGYKGARLEILDATNEIVKYKVIQNFNLAAPN